MLLTHIDTCVFLVILFCDLVVHSHVRLLVHFFDRPFLCVFQLQGGDDHDGPRREQRGAEGSPALHNLPSGYQESA